MTPQVTAIVPALNESPRLPAVLSVLTAHPLISEVIVIDDGSSDNTTETAKQFNTRLIKHDHTLGKGRSMDEAVQISKNPVIFFCDADVTGLTTDIVTAILTPALQHKCSMFVAVRFRPTFVAFPWLLRTLPHIGGERALTKELWQQVPATYKNRFQIEIALNSYAKKMNGLKFAFFPTLGQTIKEKKYGLFLGLARRLRMSASIAWGIMKLWIIR